MILEHWATLAILLGCPSHLATSRIPATAPGMHLGTGCKIGCWLHARPSLHLQPLPGVVPGRFHGPNATRTNNKPLSPHTCTYRSTTAPSIAAPHRHHHHPAPQHPTATTTTP